jgi:hypothetical protein
MSILENYRNNVALGKRHMLQEKDGWWWGRPIQDYLHQKSNGAYMLNVNRLQNRAPELIAPAPSAQALKAALFLSVDTYFKLNIFKKIWWRLTRPMGLYFQLYTAITLGKMAKALNDGDIKMSAQIYQVSVLPKLVSLWDKLSKGWRSLLHDFHLENSGLFSGLLSSSQIMTSSLVLYSPERNPISRPEESFIFNIRQRFYERYEEKRQILTAALASENIVFDEVAQTCDSLIKEVQAYLQQIRQRTTFNVCTAEKDKLLVEIKALCKQIIIKIHPDRQNNHGQEEASRAAFQTVVELRESLENQFDRAINPTAYAGSMTQPMSAGLYNWMASDRQFFTDVIEKEIIILWPAINANTAAISKLTQGQAETKNELAETKNELAETKNELAETKRKQAETERKQAEAERKQAETDNELAELRKTVLELKAKQTGKSSSAPSYAEPDASKGKSKSSSTRFKR